ncbi:14390_t:CDS:2 [Dentiscutata erythropus]|uniref:14390_t:CDS:1 n=1 Tax=Dentiscutata erythropus TaxID=1348616 RepID=A0A9N9IT63_9GLOM|nr:14390_t:CDS:2 [Dentiscutata erythropus]
MDITAVGLVCRQKRHLACSCSENQDHNNRTNAKCVEVRCVDIVDDRSILGKMTKYQVMLGGHFDGISSKRRSDGRKECELVNVRHVKGELMKYDDVDDNIVDVDVASAPNTQRRKIALTDLYLSNTFVAQHGTFERESKPDVASAQTQHHKTTLTDLHLSNTFVARRST